MMRSERRAKSVEGRKPGLAIQSLQPGPGGEELPDPLERLANIAAIEDRFVHVFECRVDEARCADDLFEGLCITQRERIRPVRLRAGLEVAWPERVLDGHLPFIALGILPDDHDQPATGAQSPRDVRKRTNWIAEEHRSESTDDRVDRL